MRTARCLLAGALLGYAAVLMSSEPWAHEEWPEEPERDPEQGSQPDHDVPFVPAWPSRTPPPGREAWPCPRDVHHDALRDRAGNIYCCECEATYGEGHYLPENTLKS